MNYKFDGLVPEDLALIGEGLNLLPHGRVQKVVAKMQAQINEQEAAERERVDAEQKAALDGWRENELAKLRAELKPRKPRRKGH